MHNKHTLTAGAVLAICLVLVMCALSSPVHAAARPLIVSGRQLSRLQSDGARPGSPNASRWRSVDLDPAVSTSDAIVEGDTLTLDLFSDAVYSALVDRVTTNVNGTVTVRGRIEGNPLAYAIVTSTGGRSLIEIEIPEKNQHFVIQSDTSGNHYLNDVSAVDQGELEEGPSPVPPVEPVSFNSTTANAEPNAANGPLDPATIDVMIVYTPAARIWADSSGGGIANVIAQAMAKGQLTCDNSNTALTLRLAHSAEIDYTESGTSSTDLDRLTNTSDGHMDTVHTLRNQYYADVVTLLAQVSDTGGIGWLLNSTSGRPTYAFNLCRVQQSSGTYTVVHEQGHNMGCGHHKAQLTQPGPGLFSYSAGWRWVGTNSGKYCSVMTYASGSYFSDGQTHTTVAHWSNPSVNYQGVSSGQTADGDNARSIREVKHVVAAYRACTAPSIGTHPVSRTTCLGGLVTFTVAATGTAPLSYQWRKGGSSVGTNSPSYTISSAQTTDAGSYDCVVTGPCGSATSNLATLTVGTGPSITSQPSNAVAWVGGPATFSVTASGTGTLTYRWRKGGSNIGGATGASHTIAAAALSDSGSYDCLVTDDCGPIASTAATLAVVTPTATIASVKLMPDAQPVSLLSKPITYASANYFYVEETNRSSGIRVERTNHGLTAGHYADLAGSLSTNVDSERFIAATSAIGRGTVSASAVAIRNAKVGGADWHYNSVTHAGQKGATDSVGLNNIGLLIQTWGSFTKTSETTFSLDDGSGSPITCVVEPPLTLQSQWQYASAIGVSSLFRANSTTWWPRMLVREIRAY